MSWDRRFLDLAHHVAAWSKDPSTKVGAVVVNDLRQVVGLGYNGFPRGVEDYESRYANRDKKYQYVVHAEANALLNAQETRGCTLYCTLCPCASCTGLLIQAGIVRVRYPDITEDIWNRWGGNMAYSFNMMKEAGIDYASL